MRKNMGFFALGTILTKVLSFCIAPVYSYFLTTADFGVIDLLTSLASLIYPVLTLAVQEAVLRFVLSDKDKAKDYFTNGGMIFLIGALCLASAPFIIGIWYPGNAISVSVYYLSYFLFTFLQVFSKSLNKTASYSLSSIIYSLVTVGCIILFLNFTDLGANGYFYGMSIGAGMAFLYLFIRLKIWKYVSFSSIKGSTLSEMIRYAAPLILNNVSYWIISGSDKLITITVLGEDAAGILSVIHKVPTLCTLAYSIFYDAYIIEALSKHSGSGPSENQFYSSLFDDVLAMLAIGLALIALVAWPFTLLYEQSYREAWQYIPLYSFATALGSIRNFYAPFFMIQKKTGRLTCAVLLGSIINLVSCFLLMKFANLGLWATALSTILGNGAICVVVIFASRRFVSVKPSLTPILSSIIAFAACLVPCLGLSLVWLYILSGVAFLAVVALNFKRGIKIVKSFIDDYRPKRKPVDE